MQGSYYDTALVCTSGHTVNNSAESWPAHNSPYCEKCGAKTMDTCPKCQQKIRGEYHVPGVVNLTVKTAPPRFCHHCGEPYPWTESSLNAAREYIRELDGLDDNERGIMSRSLDDLVRDTPNSNVAVLRFKKLAAKVGLEAWKGLKEIIIRVVTEGIAKQL